MTGSSVMPQPWFRAQAFGTPIHSIIRMQPHRVPVEGERVVGPFILPPFQRPAVWSMAQKVKLIESIWDGLPIGSYVFNLTTLGNPCDAWLLDGQQRLTALVEYAAGEFPVYGWCYPDLPQAEQRGFQMRPIGALETNIADQTQCREIYNRLAYGGTAHELECTA